MGKKEKNFLIVYGTSTGTAREVALRIAREAYSFTNGEEHLFVPEVLNMKDVSVEGLVGNWGKEKGKKVVFVVSTTGQGEFPVDCKRLWGELCRKSNVPEVGIEYGVVGLGDSSYEMYNYPGKKLHRRLEQLKGSPAFELCLCDDQHDLGYVWALNKFLEECWRKWVPDGYRAEREGGGFARFTLCEGTKEKGLEEVVHSLKVLERRQVILNERVTATDHFQDTRLITFETSRTPSKLTFEEGDVLQVYPESFPENVQLFFEIFPQLRNQSPFYVHCDAEMGWEAIPPELMEVVGPMPWTWEKVASQLLDLQSIPGQYVFEILYYFAEDPLLKEKFGEMLVEDGLEALYTYVNRPRRTIIEVLQDFPGVAMNIPANYIFELIPFLRPRAFSICSPPKDSFHIEILVAVVEYKTNLKKMRKGTCSYWLAHHCPIDYPVAVFCEKGSLRPPKTDCHAIMIGPGTGVAPFRSMIMQHLNKWDKHLFFGCRGRSKDNYFANQFEEYVREGQMKLYTAVSRDESGQKMDYVQDLLLGQVDLVKSLLESPLPLYIYVCGRSGDMPKDVYNAFKILLEKIGFAQADQLLKEMLKSGQYQTETY